MTEHLTVRRVHWLRARAQLSRWREEVTLTTHEMQWTVKYFLHQSRLWQEARTGTPSGTSSGTTGTRQTAIHPGNIAYSKRKQVAWKDLMIRADHTFALLNIAYQSPL